VRWGARPGRGAAAVRWAGGGRMPLGCWAAPASLRLLAARSTSARVMVASGPLGCTRLRSTSSLRASTRTAGGACGALAWERALGGGGSTLGSWCRNSPTTVPVSVSGPSANSTRGAPTFTRSPLAPNRRAIRPLRGDGTSTTALSVSTESSGWSATTWSPCVTCQATISASARPSPRSGSRNWYIARPPIPRSGEPADLACGVDNAADRGQVVLLKARQRHDRVVAGHPDDRRQERPEAAFGDQRGDLGAKSAGPRCLVHDDGAARFGHRGENRFLVVGFERRK